MGVIKTVVEIDQDLLSRIDSSLLEIKRGLQNANFVPNDEFLTSEEFMAKVKVSRWKFDLLIKSGKLQHKKIGRKYYIPANQVTRYFAGELTLD